MSRSTTIRLILFLAASLAGLLSEPCNAQEHVPDAHTQLLLHCNGSLTGAAGEAPLTASGYSFSPGIFADGVNLPTGNQLTYASAGNINASQGTAEFWLKPGWNGNDGQDHLAVVWGTWGGILLGKDGGNYWRIIVNRWGPGGTPERGAGIHVGDTWVEGEWHHCAFTWSSESVRVYVDGELHAEEPVGLTLPAPSASSFQIGGEGSVASLGGLLDEVRLSDVVRTPVEVFDSYARGLTIAGIEVQPDPVLVTEGFSTSPGIVATRPGGGELTVPPALCAWTVVDPTIAEIDAEGRVHGLLAGTTLAACTWHGQSDDFTIQVQPALPAPLNPAAEGFRTTSRVRWDPVVHPDLAGYELQRRPAGGTFTTAQRVLARTDCTDGGLTPGAAYEYRVAGINAGGMPLTAFSAPCAVTPDLDVDEVSVHKSMEILVAFYTDGYTPEEVVRLTNGVRWAMEFYWRTSGGRLCFDPTWLYIDAPLPAPEWGAEVEVDLRARGVQDGQYDLAYLIGNGLIGCYGGYLVLGGTCASLGTACGVPYPGADPDVDNTIIWTFTHEIHHALELMENITGESTPEVFFCHFPWCYPDPLGSSGLHMDWAAHYDGIAQTNREYGDAWLEYPAPYDQILECRDSDQDGLPDDDARAWSDEVRFDSEAEDVDTDGDGLGDLEEYCRYDHRSTDPRVRDTDGDALEDGIDPEPLYKTTPRLSLLAAAPVIDGSIEPEWPLLASDYYYTHRTQPLTLRTFAGWRSDGLYLAFESSAKLRFMVSLDGSGQDGRFESPVRHTEGHTDTDNLDNKQNHIGDSWGDGHHIYFAHGLSTVEVFGRAAIPGAQVASSLVGGVYRTEVRIPAALPKGAAYTWYPAGAQTPVVAGLTLEAGAILGLNVTLSDYSGSDGNEFSGTWTSLFETHSYLDLELVDASGANPGPVIASAPGLYLASPYRPGGDIVLRAGNARGEVRIELFDLLGRRVRTIFAGPGAEETVRVCWDGRTDAGSLASPGVYFLRGTSGPSVVRRKITVLGR